MLSLQQTGPHHVLTTPGTVTRRSVTTSVATVASTALSLWSIPTEIFHFHPTNSGDLFVFYLPILTSPVLVFSQHSLFHPLPIFEISHRNLTHLYCSKNYLPLKCQFPLKTVMMNISASSPPMGWPPLLHCCLIYLRVQATCHICMHTGSMQFPCDLHDMGLQNQHCV